MRVRVRVRVRMRVSVSVRVRVRGNERPCGRDECIEGTWKRHQCMEARRQLTA